VCSFNGLVLPSFSLFALEALFLTMMKKKKKKKIKERVMLDKKYEKVELFVLNFWYTI
jgi:hypothetical protein